MTRELLLESTNELGNNSSFIAEDVDITPKTDTSIAVTGSASTVSVAIAAAELSDDRNTLLLMRLNVRDRQQSVLTLFFTDTAADKEPYAPCSNAMVVQ